MTASPEDRQQQIIVELSDVHVTLTSSAGPVQILRGIDLQIDTAETVSVVGPSGAGKSTMMMIMAGLERPSSGSVRVAGHELTRWLGAPKGRSLDALDECRLLHVRERLDAAFGDQAGMVVGLVDGCYQVRVHFPLETP